MTNQAIEQLSYRILLSIGDSLDLRMMLGKSLATYLKELGCTMGAVLFGSYKEEQYQLELAYAIPRSIQRIASFASLLESLEHTIHMQDIHIFPVESSQGGGTYLVMSIADIGLLVLYTQKPDVDRNLFEALRPLNHKLGTACKACLQNTELKKSSERFMEMANMLPGLILELDKDHHVTFFNRRTQELFQQIDSDEFNPDQIEDFFPPDEISHIHQVLATISEQRQQLVSDDFWMENSRGKRFKVNLVLSPIYIENQLSGFRGIATDITERVRLEEEQKALLKRVSDRVRELDCLFNILKLIVNETHTLEDIFTKAIPLIHNTFEAQDRLLVGIEYNGKTYGTTVEQPDRSTQLAPIFSGTTKKGQVMVQAQGSYQFTEEEVRLVVSLSTQFSAIVAKKETEDKIKSLYDEIMEDLDTAQSIQNYILPRWFKAEGNVIFSSNYRPWAQIGGDLYDCLRISESRYILYVADISGHGVQAALIMMAVKSILGMILSTARTDCSIAEIVTRLNRTLSEGLFKNNYLTLCFSEVNTDTMTVKNLNAGHPPMVIINRKKQTMRVLNSTGDIPLGWIPDHVYTDELIIEEKLSHDDMLCLYTDGAFETTNEAGDALSLETFLDLLKNSSTEQEVAILPQDCHEMLERTGYVNRQDDFTCVALQVIQPSEYSTVLELPASLEMVDHVAQQCANFVLNLGKSESDAWKCRIVASEFMNNIIVHGLENSIDEIIALEVSVKDDITLTIRDRAEEWKLPAHPDSAEQFFDTLNLDGESHGRGMQIIYSLTSEQRRRRVYRVNETTFVIPTGDDDL